MAMATARIRKDDPMTKPVVIIHDAAIDEYMSTILLTTMPDLSLDGIVIVNADCIYGPAMDAAWRIQQFIGRTDIPLSLSNARGLNPFPWEYRADCIKQGRVAALAPFCPQPNTPPYADGDAWLEQYLDSATEQVTLLCLCPATPIVQLLQKRPDLEAKIERIVWMAGAVNVAGNLDPTTLPVANQYAEWNVFWDPAASDWLLRESNVPIVVFPLDVTNQAKLDPAFLAELLVLGKTHSYANLASQSYALVSDEPFYEMWDVVTTCYLSHPEFFAPAQTMQLAVATAGDMEGGMLPDPTARSVDVVMDIVNLDAFCHYVLGQLSN